MRDANLRWARFNRSDLRDADLRGASVAGLNLTEADLNSTRMPADVDRSRLVGLDRARNVERARW